MVVPQISGKKCRGQIMGSTSIAAPSHRMRVSMPGVTRTGCQRTRSKAPRASSSASAPKIAGSTVAKERMVVIQRHRTSAGRNT